MAAASLGLGAVRLRRRLLPSLAPPATPLAALVLAIALFVTVVELAGMLGVLHPAVLTAACVVTGAVAARLGFARRSPLPASASGARAFGWESCAAAVAVLPVLALWAARTVPSLRDGMSNEDSLLYHMPYAAHFAQTGSITGLVFPTSDPLSSVEHGAAVGVSGIATFYPMTSSLFHAAGMLFFGSDLISPALNFGWLLAFLLACWCLGSRYGAGAPALAAGAVIAGTGALAVTQAGEATNDMIGLFFFIAGVALLAHSDGDRNAQLLAAVCAGLALGTKLSLVAPALALTLAFLWLARRTGPARIVAWFALLAAFGGYWYARNLAAVGNPLPSLHLAIGPLHLAGLKAPVIHATSQSLADYATNWQVWRTAFIPALTGYDGLGHAWPVILLLAVAGVVGGLVAAACAEQRLLALVALACGIAYVFTPATAGGAGPHNPAFFFFTMRYASPALALSLVLLTALPLWFGRRRLVLMAALAATSVATVAQAHYWPPRSAGVRGFLVAMIVLAAVVLYRLGGRAIMARPALAVVALAALAVGVAHEAALGDSRYAKAPVVGRVYAWAASVHHARIAVSGTIGLGQYPLVGRDFSNAVRYVGRRTSGGDLFPVGSCQEWRAALNRGRYRYAVTSPVYRTNRPIETSWTGTDPAARLILSVSGVSVFRLERPLDPGGCR
jgi:hypothetical protein